MVSAARRANCLRRARPPGMTGHAFPPGRRGRQSRSPRFEGVDSRAALVVLFGFFVLGLLAYRTYVAGPPIPAVVLAEDGAVVFSGEDVKQGQRIFLRAGLMEFGSVFGHGAYLGPDFTADYLRRSAVSVTETYERAGERNVGGARRLRLQDEPLRSGIGHAALHRRPGARVRGRRAPLRRALRQARDGDRRQRSRAWPGRRTFTRSRASSRGRRGSPPQSDRARATRTRTTGPPEPLVRNQPTAAALVCSMLSLAALLGGSGLLFAAFGRWDFLGWHRRDQTGSDLQAPA